jgi:hypothetical protein
VHVRIGIDDFELLPHILLPPRCSTSGPYVTCTDGVKYLQAAESTV